MAIKRLALGLFGAVALMGSAALFDSADAQRGQRCRNMVSGDEAKGKVRFFTDGKARRSWSAKVTRRYSGEYASWSLAEQRRMNCKKRKPGRTWHCVATGIPCNRARSS